MSSRARRGFDVLVDRNMLALGWVCVGRRRLTLPGQAIYHANEASRQRITLIVTKEQQGCRISELICLVQFAVATALPRPSKQPTKEMVDSVRTDFRLTGRITEGPPERSGETCGFSRFSHTLSSPPKKMKIGLCVSVARRAARQTSALPGRAGISIGKRVERRRSDTAGMVFEGAKRRQPQHPSGADYHQACLPGAGCSCGGFF
jgi:hypothetical protein